MLSPESCSFILNSKPILEDCDSFAEWAMGPLESFCEVYEGMYLMISRSWKEACRVKER